MTRQEMIAAALLAADDKVSAEQGEKTINAGRQAKHCCDGAKWSWECPRCRYDDYIGLAERLEDRLQTFGLSIAG